jgi:hypothetical protein
MMHLLPTFKSLFLGSIAKIKILGTLFEGNRWRFDMLGHIEAHLIKCGCYSGVHLPYYLLTLFMTFHFFIFLCYSSGERKTCFTPLQYVI